MGWVGQYEQWLRRDAVRGFSGGCVFDCFEGLVTVMRFLLVSTAFLSWLVGGGSNCLGTFVWHSKLLANDYDRLCCTPY